VVGLTLFDMRRRGKVGKLSMVGTTGKKFPAISMSLETALTVGHRKLIQIQGNT